MNSNPIVVWFRQDLRLEDNPALSAAISRGCPILPVYIWSPQEEGDWPPGAASKWWLHYSLESLNRSFIDYGGRLIVRQGETLSNLRELAAEVDANAVYWNRRYEPSARRRDEELQKKLELDGIEVQQFNASLLFEPSEIQNLSGRPFQVFTPFWKACMAALPSMEIDAKPEVIQTVRIADDAHSIASLELLPTPNWAKGIASVWEPGEHGAQYQLQKFLESAVYRYPEERDRPDIEGVSRLSPHLHFGEIGPRQIFQSALQQNKHSLFPELEDKPWGYLRQLGWREFSNHLLYHFPQTPTLPLRSEFTNFPWKDDEDAMKAWQRGRTGYPLVDAGMRELWATGWMHNRVRMVVASFLVKDLLIPWQSGARWFWDTLADADLANNTMGWQWTAGCGADAAPYFRIFNPVRQGERFDPDGDYVRLWVPELNQLPAEWIHRPWEAPITVLQQAGVVLGQSYPQRIVDHHFARERALTALASMK